MKLITTTLVAAAALLSLDAKAKDVNARKITCEEFVGLEETVKPKVVFFIEGATKTGKREDAVLSIDEVSKPVAFVVDECRKTPQVTVWRKVEDYFKSVSKKL